MPRSEGIATETSENGKREKSADYTDYADFVFERNTLRSDQSPPCPT
jgi:hypothetical protein